MFLKWGSPIIFLLLPAVKEEIWPFSSHHWSYIIDALAKHPNSVSVPASSSPRVYCEVEQTVRQTPNPRPPYKKGMNSWGDKAMLMTFLWRKERQCERRYLERREFILHKHWRKSKSSLGGRGGRGRSIQTENMEVRTEKGNRNLCWIPQGTGEVRLGFYRNSTLSFRWNWVWLAKTWEEWGRGGSHVT